MDPLSDKLAGLTVVEKEKEEPENTISKLRTGVVYDERMQAHKERSGCHPECPERIGSIWKALNEADIVSNCLRVPARDATMEEIVLVHSVEYYHEVAGTAKMSEEELLKFAQARFVSVDYMNKETFACALLSAGSVCEVTSQVLTGKVENAIAVVRPPGHHAEYDEAIGYCFFNNVALAAKMAVEKFCLERVLIVDWDVHHGNGIQHMFYDDKRVLYVSLHRYDNCNFFPGSPDANYDKIGNGDGSGYNVNVAWSNVAMGDGDYLSAFHQVILPVAREYNPQLVIVTCGFDSGRDDPIGRYKVTPEGYAHMTSMLRGIANGKMVVALEGGYNLTTISESMCSVARVLLGEAPPMLDEPCVASNSAQRTIINLAQALAPYWKSLHQLAMCDVKSLPEPEDEGQMFAKYPQAWCPHLVEMNTLPDQGLDTSIVCEACGVDHDNWVCLTCFRVYCGRNVNQHMLRHNEETGHKMVLSFANLSSWCYACDLCIHNKALIPYIDSAHRHKFGKPSPYAK